jgi:hypothetical protein
MRGRVGGIIGLAGQPTAGSASRVWALGEVYSAIRGLYSTQDPYSGSDPWPSRVFTITWPGSVDYADATNTGGATFSPEVRTASSSQPFTYYWERSTDDGATWSTVSGSSGNGTTEFDYNSYSGYVGSAPLTVTGQTIANDEDLYRLVATSGLKTFYSAPATLRFDNVTISVTEELYIAGENDAKLQERTVEASWPWGIYFVWFARPLGQKYNVSYPFTLVQKQVSTDGGTTWSTFSSQENYDGSPFNWAGGWNFMQTTADNGKKYRVILTYKTASVTTRVVTLYVT